MLPDRVGDVWSMSRDVPKSESIARGLAVYQLNGDSRQHNKHTHIKLPSSHVSSTLPGLRSRCNIERSCWHKSFAQGIEIASKTLTRNANPLTTSLNKLFTSSALSKWTGVHVVRLPPSKWEDSVWRFIASFSAGVARWYARNARIRADRE